jgi:signal peptidase I
MFQLRKLQKKYAALLQKVTAQHIFLNQKIELWKFSQPERAATLETKKHTIERSLQQVHQLMTEEAPNVALITQKLVDVEQLFESLQIDIQPQWQSFFKIFFFSFIILLLLKPYVFSVVTVTQGTCEPTLLVGDNIVVNKLEYLFSPVQHGDLVLIEEPNTTEKLSELQRWWQKYIGIKISLLGLPESAKTTLTRIFGLPNDQINGKIDAGIPCVYRNEKKITERYINQYPLIALKQKKLQLDNNSPFAHFIPPAVLKNSKNTSVSWVTFDENEPLNAQPFYKIAQSDILLNPKTKQPFLQYPYQKEICDTFSINQIPEKKYWCMNDNRRNINDSRTFGLVGAKEILGKVTGVLYSIDSHEESWLLELIKNPKSFFSNQMRKNRFLQRIK